MPFLLSSWMLSRMLKIPLTPPLCKYRDYLRSSSAFTLFLLQ